MAARKETQDSQETQVDQATDIGGRPAQVKPTNSFSDVKDRLAVPEDAELHPDQPEKQADQSSYPVANDADVHDPPLRSPRPDTPLIHRLATGAGAHQPPDPDLYSPEGRPILDQ